MTNIGNVQRRINISSSFPEMKYIIKIFSISRSFFRKELNPCFIIKFSSMTDAPYHFYISFFIISGCSFKNRPSFSSLVRIFLDPFFSSFPC